MTQSLEESTLMNDMENTIWGLLGKLEYHFFIVEESDLKEIKEMVTECYYTEALCALTDYLGPFIEHYEELFSLLSDSWELNYSYHQKRFVYFEEAYKVGCAEGRKGRIHESTHLCSQHFKANVDLCEEQQKKMIEYQNRLNEVKRKGKRACPPPTRILTTELKVPFKAKTE